MSIKSAIGSAPNASIIVRVKGLVFACRQTTGQMCGHFVKCCEWPRVATVHAFTAQRLMSCSPTIMAGSVSTS